MDITQMDFISIFLWLYNIGAAFIILFLIIQILLISRKVNTNIIRARLFLDKDIMNQTWKYISIAGASFAVNSAAGFLKFNLGTEFFYVWEITEAIFIAAFITMIYQWYQFIGELSISEASPH